MAMAKRYNPSDVEPALLKRWQELGIYAFQPVEDQPVFSIDTPPPTVSGQLHLGHVFSYSHPDFIARYRRMTGHSVFYPMGFDDNGLPTERLVEKTLHLRAAEIGREAFIQKCLEVSASAEQDYRALWQRLGLSIDWNHTYRTIDRDARQISQFSFLDLYHKGLAYRREAPSLWCPECRTAIAQAELEDLERQTEFITLPLRLPDSAILPIATTRPELLAACVAVFVHPEDTRYQPWIGQQARVPLYGQQVPILTDPAVDPGKGTGAVMCCTFGDQADVTWWYTYGLPLVEAVDRQGLMAPATGPLAGLTIPAARQKVKELLAAQSLVISRQPISQSVRVHERCDTPVETIITRQWFVRVLENRETFLEAGRKIHWHPEQMHARYQAWVENLNWDWCISRQRYYGVTFPVWYCQACSEPILAAESQLPVDPTTTPPPGPCTCGSSAYEPETDVMDTWATSSLSPQIITGWLDQDNLRPALQSLTLRPQAHEIIRTWAFYTIVKSHYHFGRLPWSNVLISGWGIAGEGMGKISKSRGGGPMPPLEMIERYSADALRYWASSTGPGKDAVINEEKIQAGTRLVTKLWNVARFAEPYTGLAFLAGLPASLTTADRWILARAAQVTHQATLGLEDYEYASARNEIEAFFWHDLADNYLEMAKQRLYTPDAPTHAAACWTLKTVLLAIIKLFAPFLPYITDAIYLECFGGANSSTSIHTSKWPQPADLYAMENIPSAVAAGDLLVAVATAVRRFKSEKNLGLGSELDRLQLAPVSPAQATLLEQAAADLMSVTRSRQVQITNQIDPDCIILSNEPLIIAIKTIPPAVP